MLEERIREAHLSNGLKVLTYEDHTSPTASVQVWYRVGSRNERPGITGISHVFEHLMFKGTRRRPEGEFDRIVQENGMVYNAFTTRDYTAFYEAMASDRYEIALDLEADRMQGLDLTERTFQSEMAVIREERRQTVEDPPFGLLSEAVEASLFWVYPYHWPIIGWMSDLEALTLEDVQSYYRDYYRPNNAVLVVAGDVTHAEVLERAERHFGSIPRGPELPTLRMREPEQRGERTVEIRKPVQLPGLMLAYRAPEAASRDAKVLNIVEFLLLHGRSSRLYQRMIYREQLATGLGGGIHLRTGPSIFLLRGLARPGVAVERLQDAFEASLSELAEDLVREPELAKARNGIEADFVFSLENHQEVGQNLGEEECRTSWRDFVRWVDDHSSVTPEEIREVVRRTFRSENRVVGRLVPEAASRAAPSGQSIEPATGQVTGQATGQATGRASGEATGQAAGPSVRKNVAAGEES